MQNENIPPKKCTKASCQRPAESGYQRCQTCRVRNATQQQNSRQRKRQREEEHLPPPSSKVPALHHASARRPLQAIEVREDGGRADASGLLPRSREHRCSGHHNHGDTAVTSETQSYANSASPSSVSSGEPNTSSHMREGIETYAGLQDFFEDLRAQIRESKKLAKADQKSALVMAADIMAPVDPLVTAKDRVRMVAEGIWQVTGYRFRVKDHTKLKTGYRSRYICCQDSGQLPKPNRKRIAARKPEAKTREHVGMVRFDCQGRIRISCRIVPGDSGNDSVVIEVRFTHQIGHTSYDDVRLPAGAEEMIRENLVWNTPAGMANQVQAVYPEVTTQQIHRAWSKLSEGIWKKDELQMLSAQKLLDEHPDSVDVFDITPPEGVEMLAFGLKKIASPLAGSIVEVGMDATYSTNSRNLELYAVIGEVDNAGFPLSYCLLSTASSIVPLKRMKALMLWTTCLRDHYGINPRFIHIDKDMAEIGCAHCTWTGAKVQLCWWHLRKAVRERLKLNKLGTVPYNALEANRVFPFIDINFRPKGEPDPADYEVDIREGIGDDSDRVVPSSGNNDIQRRFPPGLRTAPVLISDRQVNGADDSGSSEGMMATRGGDDMRYPGAQGVTAVVVVASETRHGVDGETAGETAHVSAPGGVSSQQQNRAGTSSSALRDRTRPIVIDDSSAEDCTPERDLSTRHDRDDEVPRHNGGERDSTPALGTTATMEVGVERVNERREDGASLQPPSAYVSENALRIRLTIPSTYRPPALPTSPPAFTPGSVHPVDSIPPGLMGWSILPSNPEMAIILDTPTRTSPVRRIFCPEEFRDGIVVMIERHLCAHPLIPGYCRPTPAAIYEWAVKEAYDYCKTHDLSELWAYLWGNWYRKGRWELWARSQCAEIPLLKTTMMVEAHWRRIKKDFLHHFHKPRVDLLCWILIEKLAPKYYEKLARMNRPVARYRQLPCWRKHFAREWRRCVSASITDPTDTKYAPDVRKWVCTCHSFVKSRFLVCKHLVQLVKPVPAIFFAQVTRNRTTPFWSHPLLTPLDEDTVMQPDGAEASGEGGAAAAEYYDPFADTAEAMDQLDDEWEADEDDEGVIIDRSTFQEKMLEHARLCREFADGLEYQIRFQDSRFLATIERYGHGFFRLASDCLDLERRTNSTRTGNPNTWATQSQHTMWYRTRPRSGELDL